MVEASIIIVYSEGWYLTLKVCDAMDRRQEDSTNLMTYARWSVPAPGQEDKKTCCCKGTCGEKVALDCQRDRFEVLFEGERPDVVCSDSF